MQRNTSTATGNENIRVTESKFLVTLLRHGVDGFPLDLDDGGWAAWDEFLRVVQQRFPSLTEKDVKTIVESCPKRRFRCASGRISAWYGHSLPVHEQDSPVAPPEILYHGTTGEAWAHIQEQGLNSGRRKYVHLSRGVADATTVGNRKKGETVVLVVQSLAAHGAGSVFYCKGSVFVANGITPEFLSLLS